MNHASIQKDKDTNGCQRRNGQMGRQCPVLEVGRMVATTPRFGELSSYVKRDGSAGGSVLCEEEGIRYGVTPGLLRRFSEGGTYRGWAYADLRRHIVFRFLVADPSCRPESLLAIATYDGCVNVPRHALTRATPDDGEPVAFYARSTGQRRQAMRVFKLDGEHLPLVARLIEDGKLSLPEYADVLETFLDGLSGGAAIAPQDRSHFDAALARLGEDQSISPEFQRLARVERGRLPARHRQHAMAFTMPMHRGQGTRREGDEGLRPAGDRSLGNALAESVTPRKLHLS